MPFWVSWWRSWNWECDLKTIWRRTWSGKALAAGALALVCARADAQAPATPPAAAPPPATAPTYMVRAPLSPAESVRLKEAVDAAQAGDIARARQVQATLTNPLARRVVQWAMIDSAGTSISFFDLDAARRDLWGWPRAARRQTAAEKALEVVGLSPQRVVEWFEGKEPTTPEGVMALASAYQQLGRGSDAVAVVKTYWRDKVFEADPQARILARFGANLTADDHAKRLDLLLFGPQGPAARAMLPLVTPDVRALAEARMAFRANRDNAVATAGLVPASLQNDKGLAYERARYFRRRGLDGVAAGLTANFPAPPPGFDDAASDMWTERRVLMNALIRSGNIQGAYQAVTNHGLPEGVDYTEAEFFAGWLALTKLSRPDEAAAHFANIRKAGSSPITVSRALYWQGRAAEAKGDTPAAMAFWTEGAKYYTAFYGQLSADRAGQARIELPADPVPTAADRERFEGRDLIRAARMLADAGERDLFRTFVLAAQDTLPTAEELALLVDMSRLYGDQDLGMRVVRSGATRGLYLPERGYPVRNVPQGSGLPEPAFTHAIIRQESGFDPGVASGVGARGMMQLMPATAQVVARGLGVPYSAGRLGDPEYNMRLGTAYLGQLVDQFSGSYVMASAGYNAGPGRSVQWAAECGDPRGGTTDPADFIECIPFSETRNYVMRIMEGVQIYRARLNGGTAPLAISADLKRGGWQPSLAAQTAGAANGAPCPPIAAPMAGIQPNPSAPSPPQAC
jgi:soluble lytic murein transglycosylase